MATPYTGSPMATAARNRVLDGFKAPAVGTAPYPGTGNPYAPTSRPPGTAAAPAAGTPAPPNAADWRGGGGQQTSGGPRREGDGPGYEDPDAEFNKRSPKALQRRLMRFGIRDYLRAGSPFWDSVTDLQNQANTNRFTDEGRAAFLAPRMQAITDQYQGASGQVAQNLADRGLADSSMQGLAQGALAGQAAAARAAATNDLYSAEDQRQRMDQAQLRDLMASMMGRSTQQAGSLANSAREQELQRMMQSQAQNGNFMQTLMGLGRTAAAF